MRIVIAGGGLAAGSAAATLREQGFDGEILVIGDEPLAPYDRPPLSKAYLQGKEPDLTFKPDEFWREQDINLMLGVLAERLDTSKRIVFADREELPYDKLLIATGGRPRRLRVDGADLPGVFVLRTLSDATQIRDAAAGASKAVVVGMGFIGAEVAASLRIRGVDVTAIEPFATPLERVLGSEVGASVAKLHRDHGVTMLLGDGVTAFEGDGHVERVVTTNGSRVECDLAVVGVGIEPNAEWLEGSGVAISNGVLVDAACRTNVEDVFAAGDIANHDHPLFGRTRVEHWQNAIAQGAAAARTMVGSEEPYADIHWFWSDQYDSSLQYGGHHVGPSDIVVRGKIDEPPFLAFYLQAGVLKAVFGFDAGMQLRRAMKHVGRVLDPALLADPNVDLKTL